MVKMKMNFPLMMALALAFPAFLRYIDIHSRVVSDSTRSNHLPRLFV